MTRQTLPRRTSFTGDCWYCLKKGHMKRDCRKWKFEKACATGNCWYCQKKGHMERDCRKWKFEKARATGNCWYCQKKGHMKRDCRKWKYEKAGETKNKRGNGDAVFRRSHKPCTRAEEKQDHSNECRMRRITLKPGERSNRSQCCRWDFPMRTMLQAKMYQLEHIPYQIRYGNVPDCVPFPNPI